MSPKTIVITGSTKGIGLGLAAEFMKRGYHVVISGRRQDAVDASVASLNTGHASARAVGVACDVSDVVQVQNLWRQSAKVFGRIDIWINNAGLINKYRNVGDLDPADIVNVVETNLSGAMNGTAVAAKQMEAQDVIEGWRGAIYNFEGFGSDGMTLDAEGNVYLTGKGVSVFDKAGQQIEHLDIPEGWTANVTFGGTNNDLLFITASKSIYGAQLRVKGAGRVVQK